jgi:hypothetical protein
LIAHNIIFIKHINELEVIDFCVNLLADANKWWQIKGAIVFFVNLLAVARKWWQIKGVIVFSVNLLAVASKWCDCILCQSVSRCK